MVNDPSEQPVPTNVESNSVVDARTIGYFALALAVSSLLFIAEAIPIFILSSDESLGQAIQAQEMEFTDRLRPALNHVAENPFAILLALAAVVALLLPRVKGSSEPLPATYATSAIATVVATATLVAGVYSVIDQLTQSPSLYGLESTSIWNRILAASSGVSLAILVLYLTYSLIRRNPHPVTRLPDEQ